VKIVSKKKFSCISDTHLSEEIHVFKECLSNAKNKFAD